MVAGATTHAGEEPLGKGVNSTCDQEQKNHALVAQGPVVHQVLRQGGIGQESSPGEEEQRGEVQASRSRDRPRRRVAEPGPDAGP